jgi:DNA-binding MarR family transcriptional regulator
MLLTVGQFVNWIDGMPDALEGLFWETRRLFRALAAAADAALTPLGITASDRALLEFLARETDPISVADLARKRSVSRQHIHQSLNRLPNQRWVERLPDPADARSTLLRLTDEGRSLWKEVRNIDRTVLRQLARKTDTAKVEAAAKTLRAIRETLQGESDD